MLGVLFWISLEWIGFFAILVTTRRRLLSVPLPRSQTGDYREN